MRLILIRQGWYRTAGLIPICITALSFQTSSNLPLQNYVVIKLQGRQEKFFLQMAKYHTAWFALIIEYRIWSITWWFYNLSGETEYKFQFYICKRKYKGIIIINYVHNDSLLWKHILTKKHVYNLTSNCVIGSPLKERMNIGFFQEHKSLLSLEERFNNTDYLSQQLCLFEIISITSCSEMSTSQRKNSG